MRLIVTGVKDGKTCLVENREYPPSEPEMDLNPILGLQLDALPARPPGRGEFLDTGIAPNSLRWFRVRFSPNSVTEMHHTDTVDLHTIISGSVDLILDDGAHRLEVGDNAMINGVDHGWRAGPEGCLTSIVIIGTPAP